jgi:hypothetical protein
MLDLSSFDISVSEIMAAFIFGVVGLYYFRLGRKDTHYPLIFTGLGLMLYPYFISGEKTVWIVGFALWATGYYFRNY